jgi:type II secretion system protein J
MNFAKKSRCRAFTLVEIMIAFAIFAVLVSAIYSTWTLIIRSRQVGSSVAAQVQRQRIALRTIEDSLTCVQSFQASLQYYSFVVQNGDQPMLSFVSRVPAVFPRNSRFGDFNLRRLTFTLEPGPDSEKDLVLRQNPILTDMDTDEQSYPLVLARNVQNFVIECWDTNAVDWVGEWDDTNSIPPILRISLALNNSSDPQNTAPGLAITRVVALPSMMLPGFLQSSKGGGPGPGGGPGGPGGPMFSLPPGGGGQGGQGSKGSGQGGYQGGGQHGGFGGKQGGPR